MWKIFFVTFFAAGALAQDYSAALNTINEQCTKNSPDGKVPDLTKTIENFKTCVIDLLNTTALKAEIEQAKPNGALDEVFKKYCDKTPQFKVCFNNFVDTIAPCFGSQHIDAINTFRNGTEQVVDFVCFKDGDRIALFIAEGGPECFQQKAEAVKTCLLTMREKFSTFESATSLSTTEKCQKVDEVTTCLVSALEGCDTPTPANMIEALIKFIRRGTSCPVTSS